MSTQLSQIAKRAKLDRKARLTSLAHLLTPEFLKQLHIRDAGAPTETASSRKSRLEKRFADANR